MGLIIHISSLLLFAIIAVLAARRRRSDLRLLLCLLLLFHGGLQALRFQMLSDALLLDHDRLINLSIWVTAACFLLIALVLLVEHSRRHSSSKSDKKWALLALFGLPTTVIILLIDINIDLDTDPPEQLAVTLSGRTTIRPKNQTQCQFVLRGMASQRAGDHYRVPCKTYTLYQQGDALTVFRHPGRLGIAWFDPGELSLVRKY